jgi:spore germination cell wall hydrolase CwlJ-like protein
MLAVKSHGAIQMQDIQQRSPVRVSLCLTTLLLTACASNDRSVYVTRSASDARPTTLAAVRVPPDRSPAGQSEFRCLALNLYWEARGEGVDGMTAVGWVVLNRVRSREFPSTICGVVFQGGETPPCQFSWWCDGRSDAPREAASWRQAQAVTARLLRAPPADPTRGGLFYHATSIRTPWLRKRERTARIGRHVFYR